MKLTVKLFARARDLAGSDRIELDLPEAARVADLRAALTAACSAMAPLVPRLLVAVGTDYARDDLPLTPDAEVACFPPVSGG